MGNGLILTGFRPTGELHIGHYFSLIKPLLDLKGYKLLILVADLHSLIDFRKKSVIDLKDYYCDIERSIHESLSTLFNFINPKKCIVVKQSDMAMYHYDLYYKLLMISRYSNTFGNPIFQEVMLDEYNQVIKSLNLDSNIKGFFSTFLLNHREILWGHLSGELLKSLWAEVSSRSDFTISEERMNEIIKYINSKIGVLGFASYPVLMAADILLYNPDFVLVGKDQEPHIQIANDFVRNINKTFGITVNKVNYIVNEQTIKGSDGNKMSKTSKNFLSIKSILEDNNEARSWMFSLKTHSHSLNEVGNPDECMVGPIWKILFGNNCFEALMCREGRISCSRCKQKLLSNLRTIIIRDFNQEEFDIDRLLRNGKIQAKKLIKKNTSIHPLIDLNNLL